MVNAADSGEGIGQRAVLVELQQSGRLVPCCSGVDPRVGGYRSCAVFPAGRAVVKAQSGLAVRRDLQQEVVVSVIDNGVVGGVGLVDPGRDGEAAGGVEVEFVGGVCDAQIASRGSIIEQQ